MSGDRCSAPALTPNSNFCISFPPTLPSQVPLTRAEICVRYNHDVHDGWKFGQDGSARSPRRLGKRDGVLLVRS